MVDQRFGAGLNINFGNSKGKVIGIMLLIIIVVCLLIPFFV